MNNFSKLRTSAEQLKLVLLLMMCRNSDSSSQTKVQKSLEDDTLNKTYVRMYVCTYTDWSFWKAWQNMTKCLRQDCLSKSTLLLLHCTRLWHWIAAKNVGSFSSQSGLMQFSHPKSSPMSLVHMIVALPISTPKGYTTIPISITDYNKPFFHILYSSLNNIVVCLCSYWTHRSAFEGQCLPL